MKTWILTFLLLVPVAFGATIKGSVYDFSLNPAEAVVEINTTPPQKMVASENYEFEVSPGEYLISARQIERGNVLSFSEERINITDEGTFTRDIILFPDVDLDQFKEPELDPSDFNNNGSNLRDYALAFLTIAVIGIGYVLWNNREETIDAEEDYKKVLNYVKDKKRVTQKDIRKEFPFSEAKVSLILTELEDKELIKKVKKGRGNVIILN